MAYWLFKSEPGAWSWDNQLKVGVEPWDGVRNNQASNNMKAMRIGDQGFFYHSVNERQIVGVVEVVKKYYPDPSDESGRFGMVDANSGFSVVAACRGCLAGLFGEAGWRGCLAGLFGQ